VAEAFPDFNRDLARQLMDAEAAGATVPGMVAQLAGVTKAEEIGSNIGTKADGAVPLSDVERITALEAEIAFLRKIFNRHATKGKLSASALTAALKDVAAPVLAAASSEGSCDTADYLLRRADANMSGDVDFSE
jgi:hypothetical protein